MSVPRRERLQLLLVAPMECVGDVVERLLHVRPLDGGDLEEIHVGTGPGPISCCLRVLRLWLTFGAIFLHLPIYFPILHLKISPPE